MPKRKDVKGKFQNFQFKIYGEEIERWKRIKWTAMARAVKRQEKITDTDINRALLHLPDSIDWLVTKEERKYFQGRVPPPDTIITDATQPTPPAELNYYETDAAPKSAQADKGGKSASKRTAARG